MSSALPDIDSQKEPNAELSDLLKDERVAHLVRLCARGFNRSLTRRLADHGVSFGHWVFLRILWKTEGLTQRQLAELANLTEPTVHTAMAKLQEAGIVTRRTQSGNRRKQHVYLTKKGRDLQTVLEPLAVEANNVALEGLDNAQQEALRGVLLHILENLAKDEADAEASGLRIPPTRGNAV